MYLPFSASRIRQREAQNARNNRAEIIKALGNGQISKRDLLRWGIYTSGGLLVAKNGLSPFARSAYASDATGVPRSPLRGATKFSQPMHRLNYRAPIPLTPTLHLPNGATSSQITKDTFADFPSGMNEPSAKRLSYHTDYTNWRNRNGRQGPANAPDFGNDFANPMTQRGPMEGRPPGEMFSHQRWAEFFPKVGYVSSLAQCNAETYFHDKMDHQGPDSIWSYGGGQYATGTVPPPLFKLRYGEPVIHRVYNRLPIDRNQNNGFGRNESQLHFHNAHNGAESDGAANVHHFPGTFYDYRWSTTLARRDKINTDAQDWRASGPDGSGGLTRVAGDYREIKGTLWAHDHRFFFTAENVYKGNLMMVNMYSGPDRGNEALDDGHNVNLKLPSGTLLDYGNLDFDVNLVVSDGACDANGQYFFDIFTTDGFVGDLPLVNFQYAPVLEVLPRKYRFRTLNASMSRFIQLAIAKPDGTPHQFQFIANDGNLVLHPIALTALDQQGIAERYDIVVDFSQFSPGQTLHLVNLLQQTDGRKPDKALTMADALSGKSVDPVVGAILQFKVVNSLQSVDNPSFWYGSKPSTAIGASVLPIKDAPPLRTQLTDQVPIVTNPVRKRVVEFGRGKGDSRAGGSGPCNPDCSEVVQDFPWIIKVNGQSAHSFNANRISELIPRPGEVEEWTYVNGGGGWDHPIHLHFEEGVTLNRGNDSIPSTEKNVRKDVWRLRPSGQVTFQVQFGEYGGSYVNHCHNTVHEDFAMLMRIQLLGDAALNNVDDPDKVRSALTMTPNPSLDGVDYTVPEILPEGNPANTQFFKGPTSGGTSGGTATPSTTITSAPSWWNTRAVAAPMPAAPPVISATFPSSLFKG